MLQHNQTDLDFLQERANRIGYELFVKDKVLYFQPPQTAAKETITLSMQDLSEFWPRLTTSTQVGEVVVRGWDINTKKAIKGKAGAGQETTTMGGRASGPRQANKAFGKTSIASLGDAVLSKAEADQMALGQFNGVALAYITGEGTCSGKPDLHAGNVVKIDGAGKTFSGLYYVSSITHTVSEEAFQTTFTIRRNAS